MKKIIGNVIYDTDTCETVAVRRRHNMEHEFLLRAPNGDLLLAESSAGTPLGRSPRIGDRVLLPSGIGGTVCGIGQEYSVREEGSGKTVNVDESRCRPCHPPFGGLRRWTYGEPCDGMEVDDETVQSRLVALGLAKRADGAKEKGVK